MTSLSPQSYHILLALSGRDLHGSGIARAVREETDGALQLWPATLYGTLELLSRALERRAAPGVGKVGAAPASRRARTPSRTPA